MSFDLYFVPPPVDGRWAEVMDQVEQNALDQRDLTAEDLELWDRIVDAVTDVLPDLEPSEGDRFRQLDDGEALQLTMFPGELSITTPYWFDGEDAERVVQRLRRVAAAVEGATDLVTYDPQADAPFLGNDAATAVGTFDRMAVAIDELTAQRPTSARAPRWAFWRRRR